MSFAESTLRHRSLLPSPPETEASRGAAGSPTVAHIGCNYCHIKLGNPETGPCYVLMSSPQSFVLQLGGQMPHPTPLHPCPCPPWLLYLRAFWSLCRQSMARGQCLRDCRKRCTWGRRMLLGGKRPVHSHSSSQPRSSLYLWEEGVTGTSASWSSTFCPSTRTDILP